MSGDVIGTTLLALTGGLAFLIAFYVLYTDKRLGLLPEDIETALISDIDPDYGFFSPYSWWPFVVGAAVFVFVLGFVFATQRCFLERKQFLVAMRRSLMCLLLNYFAKSPR